MKKRVFIIGGFQKAQALTDSLLKKGYSVTLINEDYDSCKVLAEFDGVTVIHGDGSSPYVLDDANAEGADIAIAITRHDEDNLVICQLCKKRFHVKKTIALISDRKKTDFFYMMGVDAVVCSVTTIFNIVQQQNIIDELSNMIPIGDGRINIKQVQIRDDSPSIFKKLTDLYLPEDVVIACILRGETNIVPRGATHILPGDVLILISTGKNEKIAMKRLTG